LRKYRRYAAFGILLFGGIAAPDASPVTMLLIAAPMYVLYEASIWIILLLDRSWRREAKA
jgi:sec-independent protein translocase protein TatC